MWFGIVSIFPEMFNIIKHYGITSYAYKKNIFNISFFNPKLYTKKNIYNKPYGGGKGVIMSYHPLIKAINAAKDKKPKALVIYVSPKGKAIDNNLIFKLSKIKSIIFISGRYEDIDYRVIKNKVDLEISIGDFIISGGELPIMMILDSISRLLPNVIKNSDSINIESFNNNLLDYQKYTRPKFIKNNKIPSILLQGNHYEISKWRYEKRLIDTFFKRPDLLYNKKLSKIDKILLNKFIINNNNK
jgi:tRNA (guanine37-N1)-methyltransferase